MGEDEKGDEVSLIFGSLCSGIGAPEAAWQPLGWRCAFAAEIEPFPSAVYAHHYQSHNLGDITKFKDWPYRPIEVLVGGTPCQSFSVAGLRKGLADPRGNLALTFLAIAECFAPTWIVWENVPGVLSADGGRAFGSFLGGLAKLGYGFAYRILDAQFFGLAQRRKRVFVVGHSAGQWQRAAAVLFERESLCGHPPPSRETGQGIAGGVANSLGGSSQSGGFRTTDLDNQRAFISCPITSNPYGDHKSRESLLVAHSLRADGFDASEDGTGLGIPLVCDCLQERDSKGADSNTKNGHLLPIALQPRIARNGRGEMGELVNALNAQSGRTGKGDAAPCVAIQERAVSENLENGPQGKGYQEGLEARNKVQSVATSYAVRRLTPTECERLQGFPDGYTAIPWKGKPAEQCPDGPRYRALGNSMTVPVMRWIGERIEKVNAMKGERK